MTRNFDAEIKNAEVEVSTTLRQLNEVRSKYLKAAAQYVRDWYMTYAEREVTFDPERTKAIGKEKLSELKVAIKTLQDSAETAIDENLDERWTADMNSVSYPPKSHPDQLERAIRFAKGRLLEALEIVGGPFMYPKHSWRYTGADGGRKALNSPYFAVGTCSSDKMNALSVEYDRLVDNCRRQTNNVEKLKMEKAKSEAADLWKNA